MSVLDRLKIRIPNIEIDVANELIITAKDRILLRIGSKQTLFPTELESICVEVVTAMYNRHMMKNEGVETEKVDVFSIKFVNNLLDEYQQELDEYKRMLSDEEDDSRRKLRFL